MFPQKKLLFTESINSTNAPLPIALHG